MVPVVVSEFILAGGVIDQRFRIEREMAAGGMGRVYRGLDEHTGRAVAIKVVSHADAQAIARFAREAVLLAELQHPGVVEYVAHGYLPDGVLYLVMEWLEGETLSTLLSRAAQTSDPDKTLVEKPPSSVSRRRRRRPDGARLAIEDVLAVARRVASTLAAIHRRGVVHRDIKPSNLVLVGGDIARVKLIDFGVARGPASSLPLTQDGYLVGTPRYMAPEQARGDGVGSAADVWALGCVLYQCLTGRAPFSEADALAAQARAAIEDPVPVAVLRPETPPRLDELVRAMLLRDPDSRPTSGDDLVAALSSIDPQRDSDRDDKTVVDATSPSGRRPLDMVAEHRVRSLVLAGAEDGSADLETLARVADSHGWRLVRTDDGRGALFVTRARLDSPREEATRAARLALALWDAAPSLPLAIATGASSADGTSPSGEMVTPGKGALESSLGGEIRLDRVTADLLEGRFELTTDDRGAHLVGERFAEGARTLLGKPSRWVGRRRELSMLLATFEDCVHDRRARAVLVTGAAGMGKSRLQYEFVRAVESEGHEVEVLRGRGDSLGAGSPFVMIAPGVRRTAGILDGEPDDVRRDKLVSRLQETVDPGDLARVAAFLGELAQVPCGGEDVETLRAARDSPILLGDHMRDAFVTWLEAECRRRPVLLVLEDLHWGDQPSVSFVDAALDRLADQPFMVLALARQEVHTAFPNVWERRAVDEVKLHPLSARACAEIVKDALGDEVSNDVVDALVARSEGNAFYLEEVVRAAAAGDGDALPDSVVGMVQARLDALDPEARRVLRAASVFGKVFWEGGVRALVGPAAGSFDVGEWLAELCRCELVGRHQGSRLPREREYEFRHELVRDAAYDMLGDDDRAAVHLLAGEWLAAAGEGDALVLAEHFVRGRDAAQAGDWFCRAAEQALGASDFAAAIDRAERGIALGLQDSIRGALRSVQSRASSWLSQHADAVAHGVEAVDALPEGSREWFRAASTAIVSSSRLGDVDSFDRLFDRAARATPAEGAKPAQLVCLCRAAFQLSLRGRLAEADAVLARVPAIEAEAGDLDALTVAQIHDSRSGRAFCVGDAREALSRMEAAARAFERAGDESNVLIGRASIVWLMSQLGDLEPAESLGRENLDESRRRGVKLATTLSKMVLGGALAFRPDKLAESRMLVSEAIEEYRAVGNSMFAGWAHGFLARREVVANDFDEALKHAQMAEKLVATIPGLRSWASALCARALLGLGRHDEAQERARVAVDILRDLGGIMENGALPPLVYAEALHARGDVDGARRAILDARDRIRARVAGLGETLWRETYPALPDPARTLALAAAWLDD